MNENELERKEAQLAARLERVAAMERELLARERAAKEKEKAKKQLLLRLSPSLWNEIAAWAEEDFRSINAQIEFLLTEAVRRRRRTKSAAPEDGEDD